jgi:hypothetical protein
MCRPVSKGRMSLIIKNIIQRAGGVVQVVEHLPSKCKALSPNPNTEPVILATQEAEIKKIMV